MIEWNKYLLPMLAGDELRAALLDLPEYQESIREEDIAIRLLALSDIYKIYVPQVMSVEIYFKLFTAMLMSLNKKETKDAILQQKNNFLGARKGEFRGIIGGSDSFSIIGKSGIGKSSGIEKAISLITGDKLIEIDTPHIMIVPILQVQCPFDCSSKSLLLEILMAVDDHIGSNYYRSGTRTGVTIDTLIGLVSQVALNHIGLLIIDEIQNVVKSKKGGLLVGMLMQLINTSGISICMVGTPESAIFFESEMQLARRSLGLKYFALGLDDYFADFCRVLFKFQYTKHKTELTDAIINWLFEHSQGVVAIVVSLVHDAQEIAIIKGIESIDIETLSMAYDERMGMLHSRISLDKKRKSQTSVRGKNKIVVPAKVDSFAADIKSLADAVEYSKSNDLDVVNTLMQMVTVEVVRI